MTLLLGACAGPVPECVEYTRLGGVVDVWPHGLCGEFQGDDSPGVIDHGDGTRSLAMAACGDAWSLGCDAERFFSRDPGGRLPVCASVEEPPTCENGETPRCVVVPCDGTVYYGPGHPMGDM